MTATEDLLKIEADYDAMVEKETNEPVFTKSLRQRLAKNAVAIHGRLQKWAKAHPEQYRTDAEQAEWDRVSARIMDEAFGLPTKAKK